MAISNQLYNLVMMLDDFTCVYCGFQSPDIEIDHLIPVSKGGPDVIENLVACCYPCNRRKLARSLYECRMVLAYGRYKYVPEEIQGRNFVDKKERMMEKREPISITDEVIREIILTAIFNGKGKTRTLQSIPGYSGRKHQALSQLYDNLMNQVRLERGI